MDVLILSHSDDPHVRFMHPTFVKRGVEIFHVDTDVLFQSGGLTYSSDQERSVFYLNGESVDVSSVRSIWNRRPRTPYVSTAISDAGIRQFCEREAESALFGALQSLDAKWVNRQESILQARQKVKQLHIAKKFGLIIPRTCISNNANDVSTFLETCRNGAVYKPLTWGVVYPNGSRHGVSIPTSVIELDAQMAEEISLVPGIYQERLKKKSEIRVTLFGTKLFAIEIDVCDIVEVDIRSHLPVLPHNVCYLPRHVENACRKMMQNFGLLYAAFDFVRSPEDEYYFLEMNPNGQWAWLEKKTGLPMSEALVDLLVDPHH